MKPSFVYPAAGETYFDNAATTMIDDAVIDAMRPYLNEKYGNPETPYHMGLEAKDAIERARQQIADVLDVKANRIFFTSGGTESNNWAIKGIESADAGIAISSVEHASVMKSAEYLARHGTVVNVLPVDKTGTIDYGTLSDMLSGGNIKLVSVQWANNELGTLQPINEIAAICQSHGVPMHSDAIQAFGKTMVFPEQAGVGMVSLSAHKIHGPMGIGALYVAEGIDLEPVMHGGNQEYGMRAGTHAVHQIVGFGAAAEISWSHINLTMADIRKKRAYIADTMRVKYGAVINGSDDCLPNILNLTIPGIDATMLVAILNKKYGICAGTGSACSTHGKSHILNAIGLEPHDCYATLRFSLSRMTTDKHVSRLLGAMDFAVSETRKCASI